MKDLIKAFWMLTVIFCFVYAVVALTHRLSSRLSRSYISVETDDACW